MSLVSVALEFLLYHYLDHGTSQTTDRIGLIFETKISYTSAVGCQWSVARHFENENQILLKAYE